MVKHIDIVAAQKAQPLLSDLVYRRSYTYRSSYSSKSLNAYSLLETIIEAIHQDDCTRVGERTQSSWKELASIGATLICPCNTASGPSSTQKSH